MPKSLVTGGAGFIGAHLVKELLGLGHDVVVLDDLSGGFRENVDARARFVEGSITDDRLVTKLFAEEAFDHVYHLAAYAAEGLSHFIRRFNYTNNLIGSVNLINESVRHGVKRFVFTSSIAVYGAGELPLRESTRPHPEDPYGIAKLAVEQDLACAQQMFGLDYTIFRPHNVYGEYQNLGDRYRNVVGIFMNQVMAGRPLSVFGDGMQTRAFSYVGDVVPAIARCVDVPKSRNEVFNVGGDNVYSVLDLAQSIIRVTGRKAELRHLPARNEVQHAYSDHTKSREVFGSTASTSLDDGVARMWRWAQERGVTKTARFADIELHQNLPSFWTEEI
ncbi:MAG: NAD-dependent epimerase/dehydratase family protein [Polyangiales bacterium]